MRGDEDEKWGCGPELADLDERKGQGKNWEYEQCRDDPKESKIDRRKSWSRWKIPLIGLLLACVLLSRLGHGEKRCVESTPKISKHHGYSFGSKLDLLAGLAERFGLTRSSSSDSKISSNFQLAPMALQPLPLGSVQPQGWLRAQMQSLANGLAGHQMDFYPFVKDNPWIGGDSEYSPLNEAFPYWYNGIVPLAYGLNDTRLQAQVLNATIYVLQNQQSNGWLGPELEFDSRSLWGRFPFLLGLMQLVQANSSMTAIAIPAMHDFVALMDAILLDGRTVWDPWGRARYGDINIVLQWLYEHHPYGNEALLLETMQRWRERGLDWAGYYTKTNYFFQDLDLVDVDLSNACFPYLHAVNVAQGLKTMAVDYRFTKEASLLQTSERAVNWTFDYHGTSSGTVVGDERQAGLAPNRGSELCTVVETMHSLSYLYLFHGAAYLADRVELTAYNALPSMLTPDSWAHQYVAQVNQPWAQPVDSNGLWWNVADNANTYGLEPSYPCCTVNHAQAFPKLLAASFAIVNAYAVAHVILGPALLATTLPVGISVSINCSTDYPFDNTLRYAITASAPFTFHLRIPGWSKIATFALNSQLSRATNPDSNTRLAAISLPAGTSTLRLDLSATLRVVPRPNATVAIYHGALLYALDIGELSHSRPLAAPYALPPSVRVVEYTNTVPWGLAIDPATAIWHSGLPTNVSWAGTSAQKIMPAAQTGPSDTDSPPPLKDPIWAYRAPRPFVTVRACPIDWPVEHGTPARVPLPAERRCMGEVTEVILRPYGSMRVRMAELPVLVLGKE